MRNSIILKVELFAGTDIKDAAIDLCALAERVGVLCEASFNGVKLWARPGDSPQVMVDKYMVEINKPHGLYRYAKGS